MAMAACALSTAASAATAATCTASSSSSCSPSSSNSALGCSAGFHGRRAPSSSCGWAMVYKQGVENSGLSACNSSSLFGRSKFHALSGGFSSAVEPLASSSGSRNVVCEVAVKIGGGQEEKEATKEVGPGTKIKVTVPLTVYHVMRSPNLNLQGLEGTVKDIITVFKGKTISANLPVKVQFFIEVEGKEVKFFAHLKEDEFEVVE